MDGTKTYVFGNDGANSGANMLSAIAPLLQQKGVDPSVLAMMNNNGGFGGNGFIWAIFLLALFGWGGNGFGGGFGGNGNGAGFLANQLNNTEGRDLLMQAIQGGNDRNHDALAQLASQLQVSQTAVQNGFQNVMTSLCNIGNQVGLTAQQTINALQNGNMQIAQQIASASSANQLAICQQTQAFQNSICEAKTQLGQNLTMLGFQTERQTATLQQTMNDNTQKILDGQKQAEIREMQAVINAQQTELASLRSAQSTQQIVAAALAPIQQAIAALQTGGATKVSTGA